ncbi:MAG TPA: reverse transcriptase, partial [Porphyromonadaceae bacterium]|nr:reverse transcriptase [Porphyromonadaceae bacterium]
MPVGKPNAPNRKQRKKMKRIGNLYDSICSLDNLALAYQKARQGKAMQYGVRLFEKNADANIRQIQEELQNGTYRTSEYSVFTIFEPKEREISRLPFRDRVVHHAIMNIMEPIWTSIFIRNTYSCIKGRGIHDVLYHLKRDLKDV